MDNENQPEAGNMGKAMTDIKIGAKQPIRTASDRRMQELIEKFGGKKC